MRQASQFDVNARRSLEAFLTAREVANHKGRGRSGALIPIVFGLTPGLNGTASDTGSSISSHVDITGTRFDASASSTFELGMTSRPLGARMHHLEPLSWTESSSSVALEGQPPVPDETQPQRAHNVGSASRRKHRPDKVVLRSTIRLIADFLRGVDQQVAPAMLAASANAALELARLQFMTMSPQRPRALDLREEAHHCLSQIETLVRKLSTEEPQSSTELAHSMDNMICLLLQLDSEAESTVSTLR